MEKLIIDRSKWRTGHTGSNRTGTGTTNLLNDSGFMCCLGFDSLRLGCSTQEILGKAEPSDVQKQLGYLNDFIDPGAEEDGYGWVCDNSDFSTKAIDINDDDKITSEQREIKIKEHFATVEVEVEFINDYVRPE